MKHVKEYENYDSELYPQFTIVEIKVDKLFDDGGASGYIEIAYIDEDDGQVFKVDNWIKYDSGPKIAFDHYYPEKINKKMKKYIEKWINKERLKRDTEKYNL